MKEIVLDINGKEFKVKVNEFGAYKAIITVNDKKYNVGLKDLGIESVQQIREKPVPVATRVEPVESAPVVKQQSKPAEHLHKPAAVAHGKSILSPLPGLIIDVLVKEGDTVKAGQDVVIMEAMKMENEIQSQFNGTVKEVKISKGQNVYEGDVLIVIE